MCKGCITTLNGWNPIHYSCQKDRLKVWGLRIKGFVRFRSNHTWQGLGKFCKVYKLPDVTLYGLWEKATTVITVILVTQLSHGHSLCSTLFDIYNESLLFCIRVNNFHILCPSNEARKFRPRQTFLAHGAALKWKAEKKSHMLRCSFLLTLQKHWKILCTDCCMNCDVLLHMYV